MSREARGPALWPAQYASQVEAALREDLGAAGDITSNALVPAELRASAAVVARAGGRVCGSAVARAVFTRLDSSLQFAVEAEDGDDVGAGDEIFRVTGRTRSILTAERTALNFLGHLSGIASATADLVRLIADYPTRLVCTRKTTPGLRSLEKYAVRIGGGSNHRWGLYDAVMIKDNHLLAVGDIGEAVERARRSVGHLVKIELEVDHLEQVREALDAGVDAVLLDNMSLEELREAVQLCRGRVLTEASGRIGPDSVVEVASTGVDLISVGWLTHSSPCLDVGLDLVETGGCQTNR